MFELESRWPKWSRWRTVVAAPHAERYRFDRETRALRFESWEDAEAAAAAMRRVNAGEYRVVLLSGRPALRD